MAKSYVKFQVPADVQAKALEVVEAARVANGLRKGVNETTKAIERGEAKLVIVAEDVDPEEIVMHIPGLAQEKKAAYCYVADKRSLGKAAGLGVGTSAIAVTKAGTAEQVLKDLIGRLPVEAQGSGHGGAAPAKAAEHKAAPAKAPEHKAAPKAAAKKEEKA
jgi:large subunit ribosomal protein L7Ae